ncbi:hypothetical protein TNCV_3617511 [Trichonephila clavipes]|nr:hypothetical protein TNCV_3617511 [Trichonephila clavipes]
MEYRNINGQIPFRYFSSGSNLGTAVLLSSALITMPQFPSGRTVKWTWCRSKGIANNRLFLPTDNNIQGLNDMGRRILNNLVSKTTVHRLLSSLEVTLAQPLEVNKKFEIGRRVDLSQSSFEL